MSAAIGCPTEAVVGSALGITVSAPVVVHGTVGSTPLPPGATGLACEYRGASLNVLIERLTNVSPSYLGAFTAHFPVAPVSVSGLGDQADAFSQSLGAGKDNEGVVAAKGSTIIDVVATATPASLDQVEALVSSLL